MHRGRVDTAYLDEGVCVALGGGDDDGEGALIVQLTRKPSPPAKSALAGTDTTRKYQLAAVASSTTNVSFASIARSVALPPGQKLVPVAPSHTEPALAARTHEKVSHALALELGVGQRRPKKMEVLTLDGVVAHVSTVMVHPGDSGNGTSSRYTT